MMNYYNNFPSNMMGGFGFGTGSAVILGPLVFIAGIIFWLWLLIDCSRRKFNNNIEKAVWIVAMIFMFPIGSIAYLIVIKLINKQGILTA
ncbi:MAG: PLDc N-terminal domain-containing protein [Patescibacteria group bacterium]